MASHWKSTPSYWCKFCSTYVRDTLIERKNHEASGKHQNGIQRNLRELQKGKQREDRDKQRAKDEVARLNGLVDGKGKSGSSVPLSAGGRTTHSAPKLSAEAQRKAHAEQLAALGVELPDELRKELTGVGGWETVSERVIYEDPIEPKKEDGEDGEEVKAVQSRGVHKRKAEDGEDEELAQKRRAWGISQKKYPGAKAEEDGGDLDALLSGIGKKPAVKKEESADAPTIKEEEQEDPIGPVAAETHVDATVAPIKDEEAEAAPAIIFKKRKAKR